jgi:hypothetical protein
MLAVGHFSLGDNGVLKAENTYVQVLTPLHDNMSGLILTRADAPTPECPYYFNGILFTDPHESTRSSSCTFRRRQRPFNCVRKMGLRQERRRHCQIDAGAVEIERVAGRDHQPHDGFLTAQIFELGDYPRQ